MRIALVVSNQQHVEEAERKPVRQSRHGVGSMAAGIQVGLGKCVVGGVAAVRAEVVAATACRADRQDETESSHEDLRDGLVFRGCSLMQPAGPLLGYT